jgi:isopenicillin N synthase-like dioxygenase
MEQNDLGIPVIDVRELGAGAGDPGDVAGRLGQACRDWGFFYVTGHGVDPELVRRLEEASRRFFAQDVDSKLEIAMSRGGKAWRGYFPVGGELTSGQPDLKEGIYFGSELDEDHPLVLAGTPLHGRNLFPAGVPHFRELVLDYIAALTRLGHRLTRGIALGLGLNESYFATHYTHDPLILFRIFNYPPPPQGVVANTLGVGEHTDYGFLTILWQDMSGGLQVKRNSEWIDARPVPNSFICNVGDMLDRLTGGYYLSAPHRVVNLAGHNRLSFAFFFDPNFNAAVKPIDTALPVNDNSRERWDRASVHEFEGTYGDYLLNKVSKVFPELRRKVL